MTALVTLPTQAIGGPAPADWANKVKANFETMDAERGVVPVTYTPTWTSSGTAPALGNGTLTGLYVRTGLMIDYEFTLQFGTTTTGGTGTWTFALPVAAAVTNWPWPIGQALFRDDSAATYLPGTATLSGASTMQIMFPTGGTGPTLAFLTPTQPVTWANIDFVRVTGRYRASS